MTPWWTIDTLPCVTRLPRVIALDCETRDPLIKTHGPGWPFVPVMGDDAGYVFMVSLAWRGDEGRLTSGVLHWRDEDGDHVPEAFATRRWLRDALRHAGTTWVLFNAPYDLGWLRAEGMPLPTRHLDAHVMAALVDEKRRSYSLNALAADWLGPHACKDETALQEWATAHKAHPKSDMWRAPHDIVAAYAAHDALLTYQLYRALSARTLQETTQPLRDAEHQMQRVLLDVRALGIRVDLDRAADTERRMTRERDALVAQALRGLRPSAARDMAGLFTEHGIAMDRTATGEPSITKAWLKTVDHDLARALLRVRWLDKMCSTYLRPMARLSVGGRVHGQLHGLRSDEGGTVSGRLSSSTPNVQNQSAKADPEGLIRGCYLPEEGALWTASDYAGQEARLAAHEAYRRRCRGATTLVRAYRRDPMLDLYKVLMDPVNKILDTEHAIVRDQSKVLFLAALYGMGTSLASKMLKVSPADGARILAAFKDGASWLSSLLASVGTEARESGFVETTILRRRARFLEVQSGTAGDQGVWYNRHARTASLHTALNRVVQGSAADQIKLAMIALHADGAVMHASVHDEIDTSTTSQAERVRHAHIMCDVTPLAVPVVVDIEYGPTWGACIKDPTIIRSRKYWTPPTPVTP